MTLWVSRVLRASSERRSRRGISPIVGSREVRRRAACLTGGYPDILNPMAKVLVSMDERLLKRLDDEAHLRGVTRSRLLSDLVEKELGPVLGPGADPKVHE